MVHTSLKGNLVAHFKKSAEQNPKKCAVISPENNFKSNNTIKNLQLLKTSLENLEWVDNVITVLDVPLLKNNDDPLAERIKNFKTLSLVNTCSLRPMYI